MSFVREYWTLLSPSNVLITCALYETAAGLELRAGHGESVILFRLAVPTHAIADAYADALKIASIARGFREHSDTANGGPE